MAFNQTTWIDRDSEHPNRRTLTNVNDPTDVKTYDMSRAEGTVTTQGTPIGASTMNDLETRIASAFTEVNNNMPVANPSGAATDELEKVKIGNTIFSVEGTSVEKGTIQNVAVASFSDGADNVPVSSLIVDIDAVQDLHGYTKPWSGGGGKNKAQVTATSQTISGVAYTVETDGRVKANGTASGASILDLGTITLTGGTTYTLSGCPSGGSGSTYALFLRGSGTFEQKIDFGGGISFTVTDTVTTTLSMIVYNGYNISNKTFEPMVRLSNTSADFEPYENICPISGFSALNVTRTGKNLCFDAYGNKASESTYLYPSGDNLPITVNNTLRTAYAYVGKNQNVVVSFASAPQRSIAYGLEAYPASGVICHSLNVTALSSTSFKLNSGNYDYIAFYYCNDLANIPSDCQIELGNQATAYEEYNGGTDTISLGQTVYGGSLNVTTGELTITHGHIDMGSMNYTYSSGCMISNALVNAGSVGAVNSDNPVICEVYETKAKRNWASTYSDGECGLSIDGTQLIFKDSDYSDPATFKTAMAGVHLVYELATPTTVQLTPTEIRTLLNNNNIFADTVNINELVYFKTGCETIARLIEAYECYIEVEGTLAAGQTSITLTNNAITSNSTIDVYTDADVDYNSITVSTGSVTITFDAQASNMKVKVRLS